MTGRPLRFALATAAALAALSVTSGARAERILTSLPHSVSFDANDYQDLIWISPGATHTWMPQSGWHGGAAKFTPPTDEGVSGLGQFILSGLPSIPAQLNVRFLIRHGATWREYGPGNKLVIMNRDGNRGRPMIITREFEPQNGGTPWETWGACDGTVCKYYDGDFWPRGGDPLKIGDPPTAREEEWICVELEANTVTGMIKLYVDTLDQQLHGLYVQRYMDDTGPGGTWAYIDMVGGYMAGSIQSHPDNYFMIDELTVDSKFIGPPAGFGGALPDGGTTSDPDGGRSGAPNDPNNPNNPNDPGATTGEGTPNAATPSNTSGPSRDDAGGCSAAPSNTSVLGTGVMSFGLALLLRARHRRTARR